MKLRNISADTLSLALPELTLTAEPDELIEVPDDVYDRYAWPDTVWSVVGTPKKTVTKTAKED